MNKIDLYVNEVGKNLPNKLRADIEAEIRSVIEDMLEDRKQKTGKDPDDDMILAVLKEYGSPNKVASSYLPEKYLIGPRLYPFFMLVLKIVLLVLTSVAVVSFGFKVAQVGQTLSTFSATFGKSLIELVSSLLQALGNIVLIFAFLQWVIPDFKIKTADEEWDPGSLKDDTEPEEISKSGMIWEIGMIAVGILIFNFYPGAIAYGILNNGQWMTFPVLSEAFFTYLPWLNLLWVLTIGINIYILRQGKWQPVTRWAMIALTIFNLIILGSMVAGPSIVRLEAPGLVPLNQVIDQMGRLAPLFAKGANFILVIVMVVESVELVKMIVHLLTEKPKPIAIN
jgi:hypothetical protein